MKKFNNKKNFRKVNRNINTAFEWFKYKPIFILLFMITTVSASISYKFDFNLNIFMNSFMSGFFISFSFFKMLNVKEFANNYAKYDIISSRFHFYGKLYPFLEFALGIAYIIDIYHIFTNIFTAILMTINLIGVSITLYKKKKLSCACVGTFINVPLSVVAAFENLLMLCMSLIAILR